MVNSKLRRHKVMEKVIKKLMGNNLPPRFKFKDTYDSIEVPTTYQQYLPTQTQLEAEFDEMIAEEEAMPTIDASTDDVKVISSNLYIESNTGYVGIGTPDPAAMLDVMGDANVAALTATSLNVTGATNTTNLGLTHSLANRTTDTVFYSSDGNYIYKNTAAGLRTALDVPSASAAVFTGNVGVGTTQPNEIFEIRNDSSTASGMRIHDSTSNAPKIDFLRGGTARIGSQTEFGLSDYSDWRIQANGPSLHIYNQYTGANSGSMKNVMTMLHNSGNVGIGTASPAAKLHVQGDLYVSSPKIENYFYGTSNWGYSLGTGTTLGNLWSFTYNAPVDGYLIISIHAHWNYSQPGSAFYSWISIDNKDPRDSSLHDSSQQGYNINMAKFHDYKDSGSAWNDYNYQTCAYVSAGNHTISLRVSKNTSYTAYINGSGLNLLFIPKNYM